MMTKKSMAIDGIYLESLIDGYTTLDVSGRESLESSLDAVSVNNRHGAVYKGKTYGTRTLSITFAIEGVDTEDLLEKLEELNRQLDIGDVTVSFVDEASRFYIVDAFTNPSYSIAIGTGTGNAVATGTFEAYCSNPFKYSTDEYVVDPEEDEDGYPVFIVDYDGTYRSYPTFEVDFYDKLKTDNHEDERGGVEEDYDDAKVFAYKPIIVTQEDFDTETYYLLNPVEATEFKSDTEYWSREDYWYDASEEEESEDEEEPDGYVYIFEESLDEDDFATALEEDQKYYTLNPVYATEFDPNAEYYIDDAEYIRDEDYSEFESESEEDEDEGVSALENEDLGNNGSCGYVAFVNDNGRILQFGNPDIDSVIHASKKEQPLINDNFEKSSAYDAATQAVWQAGSPSNNIINNNSNRIINGSFSEKARVNQKYAYIKNDQTTLSWTKVENGCKYKVVLNSVTNRTSTSAKLNFVITAKRTGATIWRKGKKYKKKKKTYTHGGTNIVAHLILGNTDFPVTILTRKQSWGKKPNKKLGVKGEIKKKKTITISGLGANTGSFGSMKFQVTSSGEVRASVSRKSMKSVNLPLYVTMDPKSYYLSPNYISANKWHGPAINRILPADSNGDVGAGGFKLTVTGKYCISDSVNSDLQWGVMGVYVLTSDNKVISGMELHKTKNSSTQAYLKLFANDAQYGANTEAKNYIKYANTESFTLSMERGPEKRLVTFNFKSNTPAKSKTTYSWKVKNKKGKTVTQTSASEKVAKKHKGWKKNVKTTGGDVKMKSVTTSEAIPGEAYRVVIAFFSQGTLSEDEHPSMGWAGIKSVNFIKKGIEDSEEVNIFHPADQLIVDCNDGSVMLNNLSAQQYGALGNDWDSMYLDSGENQIKAYYSPWAMEPMVYRKCLRSDIWDGETTYYTKDGDVYTEVTVTEEEYNQNPNNYYIREHVEINFRMRYREVFI